MKSERTLRHDAMVLALSALLALAAAGLAVVEHKLDAVCRVASSESGLDLTAAEHDARTAARICASSRLERVATPRVS